MAQFINLKCKKCQKEFQVRSGAVKNDVANFVGYTNPKGQTISDVDSEKAAESGKEFIKNITEHQKICDGEVTVSTSGFVD